MMQKISVTTLFFTTLLCSSLYGYQGTHESKKKFAFDVGYCGMWRSPLKNMSFLEEGTFSEGTPIISPFEKISFNYVSGVRALLEINQGQKSSIEAVYTGLFNWNNDGSATSATEIFNVCTAPFRNDNWTNFYYLHYHYKSELNSGELSYWRHVTPRYIDYFSCSWMLGLRYIDFRDSLHMNNGTGLVGDNASVKAINQMGGIQGGLELQANATSRMTWAIQVKGGAYADFVTRKTVFNDLGNTVQIVDSSPQRVKKDYTLELIPYILYRLNPFYFRLAYDRVILFNPVFAPLQVQPTKFVNEVYTHNYVNFQIVYASIGFYW